ncbi:hypothetical protein NP493_1413g00021 [Ridgeia piscesae]|uniref:Secreted protein n=1 Tax=Ridgeia piscesae TaxID=27915 RepID=A0AAD9K515_RIDPI|nr:hypothetical protein NP493_1413g00021 [Ridgeia piscesae]
MAFHVSTWWVVSTAPVTRATVPRHNTAATTAPSMPRAFVQLLKVLILKTRITCPIRTDVTNTSGVTRPEASTTKIHAVVT